MSLPAGKKLKIISFSDLSAGININDPAVSLRDTECADALNAIFLKNGWKRWPGAKNLTAKGAISGSLRGLFNHRETNGTGHLFCVFGGGLYEIDRSSGALTLLYDMGGDSPAWGCSQKGVFFCTNGSSTVKVEGSTAYRVGIAAPAGATVTAATSGGSLADGVYDIYLGYYREVGGAQVLYSKGYYVGQKTISGGGGAGKFTVAAEAAFADPQVTGRVIWMASPGVSTYYLWKTNAGNGAFDVTDSTPENSALTYSAYAASNDLPGALTFLMAFDNRLWGLIDNVMYYSNKGATVYDYEIWQPTSFVAYPFQANGLFSCGRHLCVNTVENGVIVQPNADVGARFEHFEQKTSFKYMRTVDDWSGNKIGWATDRIGVFSKDTFTFEPWDYGYNIKSKLVTADANVNSEAYPCGVVGRRNNRNEYLLSFLDTRVNEQCNNRTWVLNLSRTGFYDIDNYKTPWEQVGRGFTFVCRDADNVLFFGQSKVGEATVYIENGNNAKEIGIYGDSGEYIDTATAMRMYVLSKTVRENMFTKMIIENIRALIRILETGTMLITIQDNPTQTISQLTDVSAVGVVLWDNFNWGDNWTNANLNQYEYKADCGVFGYTWNLKFSQEADDIDLEVSQFDVLVTAETGRGI
jgi:hypothetical protein